MNKIAIITDTSSNLNFEICKKEGIFLIPYNIQISDNHYKDLVTISSKELFKRIIYENILTSIPSPDEIKNFIIDLKQKGYSKIIFFTTSSEITGMSNLLNLVKNDLKENEKHNLKIKIIDTKNTGICVGLISLYAKHLVNDGVDYETIYNTCFKLKDNLNVFALFKTLKYVVRGGRLPKWKGDIGEFLKINPIATIKNGEVFIREKIRGTKNCQKKLINIIKNDLKNVNKYYFGIFTGVDEEDTIYLKNELKDIIDNSLYYFEGELSSALGVHGGPQTCGCGYLIIE